MPAAAHRSTAEAETVHAHEPLLIDGPSSLGPYLKEVRRQQRLRIDDASSLFGIAVDTLSRLENGVGAVRLDKLLAVLDGLGLAMLVGTKDEMQRIVRQAKASRDESAG